MSTPTEIIARLAEIEARTKEILDSSIWAAMKPSAFMERLQYTPDLLALVEHLQGLLRECRIRDIHSSCMNPQSDLEKAREELLNAVNEINEAHAFLNEMGVPNIDNPGQYTRLLALKERLYTCHSWLAELQTMKQTIRDLLPLVDPLQLSLNYDLRKRVEEVK